jgi:hypothetical protein
VRGPISTHAACKHASNSTALPRRAAHGPFSFCTTGFCTPYNPTQINTDIDTHRISSKTKTKKKEGVCFTLFISFLPSRS